MTPSQEIWQRALALAFIYWMECLGDLIMPLVPRDFSYYIVATMFNALMFLWVLLFFTPTSMIRDLKLLLVIQAIMQLMGLVTLLDGQMPAFYNGMIKCIVPITYIRIVIGSPAKLDSVLTYCGRVGNFFTEKFERNHIND